VNRCEDYIKSLPAKDRKRVKYAVLELMILLRPMEDWLNVGMTDLILSLSTKKEQRESKQKRSGKRKI
jgi:hypothetical protein